jgi:hypothetical protein
MEVKGGQMNIRKDKRGISAVVATVLIILITVAAVTIIWAAVIPLVSKQIDKGTVCLDAVSQLSIVDEGYTCYGDGEKVKIQVRRGPKDFELRDIIVLYTYGGDTSSLRISDEGWISTLSPKMPAANEERVYAYDTNGVFRPDEVQIAPIISVEGKNETCDASPKINLRDC